MTKKNDHQPLAHDFRRGWSLLSDAEEKAAIGTRLRQYRQSRADLTLDQLSKLTAAVDPAGAGISRVALSRYETGAAYPGTRELKLLARALRVKLSTLLYGTSEDPMNFMMPSIEEVIDHNVYLVLVGQGLVKDDSPQGPTDGGYEDLIAMVKGTSGG
jgi:transcriptional regulator with XRE-family HTH domain